MEAVVPDDPLQIGARPLRTGRPPLGTKPTVGSVSLWVLYHFTTTVTVTVLEPAL